MPSKRMAIEWLKQELEKGRGDEPCHIIDIKKEQRERIENKGPRPKTRFAVETDDPEFYAEFNREKDRIIERAGNKTIGLTIMLAAWRKMDNALIDKIVAEHEGPPT